MKNLVSLILIVFILCHSFKSFGQATPADSSKYKYVGMEKCASTCHNNNDMGYQYDFMKAGPHSASFKILTTNKAIMMANGAGLKEVPSESPVCLKCHSTGAGLDSTFFAATFIREEGVTCEACHKGPYRPKTYIPVEKDCLECHNSSVHRVHRFNFEEADATIRHSRSKAQRN